MFYIFVFFLSVYFLSASQLNIYFADVGQERLEVAKSIVERSEFSIPSGAGIQGKDGRDYSLFGLGSVLLSLPFYFAAELAGAPPGNLVSTMNQLFGAATVVLVFLFSVSLGYSIRAALLTAIFYGLGTIAWYYSKNPGDHVIETLFILLSVYLMYRHISEGRLSFLFLSAMSIGCACLTRHTSVLVLPALLTLVISSFSGCSERARLLLAVRGALFCIALLPFAFLSLWYNYHRFGSIFETGYGLMSARLGLKFFTGTSLLTGLMGFLVSPGKGFFFYSPVAILFFLVLKGFWRKHPEVARCFITIIIVYIFFLSKNVYWHGDWAWGPRYLFVLTPFFIIPAAELFDSSQWRTKPYIRLAAYALFAASLVLQAASVSVHIYKYFTYLQSDKDVRFTVARGKGVKPIIEPPPETYFAWKNSPILSQFIFFREEADNIIGFLKNPPSSDQIKKEPWYSIFDFWWLYDYFLERRVAGLATAILLIILSVFSAVRLRKLTKGL